MPETITYALRNQGANSDQYYLDVAAFTDLALDYARINSGEIMVNFQEHVVNHHLESIRSEPEYLLDFYVLGMVYRIYAAYAERLSSPGQRLLAWLYRIRQNHRWIKPVVDLLRGFLSGILFVDNRFSGQVNESVENFHRLLGWMEATGEFSEETKRLSLWENFLSSQKPEEQEQCLGLAVSLAGWFTEESLKSLGKYTPNVEKFLVEKHPNYQWREDRFFCGRKREEYHLNMVGTEILNRAFRQEFLEAKTKIVLLPPCMKARQDSSCQAVPTPFGDQCGHCTPGCRIHQTTLLGEKHGFKVTIIPHELSVFSSGKIKAPEKGRIGIVGVSCPITNVTGGWETKELGVPAQGVLLDYCGCQWHWHPEEGIPTDINFNQLLKVIGN